MDDLKIKNKEPMFSLMLKEYKVVVTSKFFWWQLFIYLVLDAVAAILHHYFPDTKHILVFILFLFIFEGFFIAMYLSPFLARFAFPLLIMILELVWLLFLLFPQFMLDAFIEAIIKSDLYPGKDLGAKGE